MEIKNSLQLINERIKKATALSGRSINEVTLIAITKSQSVEAIKESIELGITNIGESYVQEALEKLPKLSGYKINWHFVGHLQTNKIKYLKEGFSFIHSIYKIEQIKELNKRIPTPLGLFFELNLAKEGSKSGLNNLEELKELLGYCIESSIHKPLGLMCIPPNSEDTNSSRKYFSQLRESLYKLNSELGINLSGLSMGMSDDFDIAIEEGATHVRIGTLLYGKRG